MALIPCCDFCGRQLPVIEYTEEQGAMKELFGEYAELSFTKEINLKKEYPMMCKSCANKIDDIVRAARDRWLQEIDISVQNNRINEARKKLLGTKG